MKEKYKYREIKDLEEKLSKGTTNANLLLDNIVGLRILGRKLLVAPGTNVENGSFSDVIIYEETIPKGKALLQYEIKENR